MLWMIALSAMGGLVVLYVFGRRNQRLLDTDRAVLEFSVPPLDGPSRPRILQRVGLRIGFALRSLQPKVGAGRALVMIERLLPARIRHEELGDALEELAKGTVRWPRFWLLWVLGWAVINALREALLGRTPKAVSASAGGSPESPAAEHEPDGLRSRNC